jgi:hypothetical protein
VGLLRRSTSQTHTTGDILYLPLIYSHSTHNAIKRLTFGHCQEGGGGGEAAPLGAWEDEFVVHLAVEPSDISEREGGVREEEGEGGEEGEVWSDGEVRSMYERSGEYSLHSWHTVTQPAIPVQLPFPLSVSLCLCLCLCLGLCVYLCMCVCVCLSLPLSLSATYTSCERTMYPRPPLAMEGARLDMFGHEELLQRGSGRRNGSVYCLRYLVGPRPPCLRSARATVVYHQASETTMRTM